MVDILLFGRFIELLPGVLNGVNPLPGEIDSGETLKKLNRC